jgi:hypothetical protein
MKEEAYGPPKEGYDNDVVIVESWYECLWSILRMRSPPYGRDNLLTVVSAFYIKLGLELFGT